MNNKVNVYFLGSGDIAVPILETLIKSNVINIVGVGTQLDRPAGRKKQLIATPIGQFAESASIQVDKIKSVNDTGFLSYLNTLNIDIILVVSFGQLLKDEILNLPKKCCVNIHGSRLPLYRGASPIVATILNGDKETGVTFMKMERGLDTGPIFVKFAKNLKLNEYADVLENDLGVLSAKHAEKTIFDIATNKLCEIKQDDLKATKVGKIKKQEGKVNWNDKAETIERKLRAFHPWPGLFFTLECIKRKPLIRVSEIEIIDNMKGQSGEILQANKNGLIIACADKSIKLNKIIPAGKTEMTGEAFLRGCQLEVGILL